MNECNPPSLTPDEIAQAHNLGCTIGRIESNTGLTVEATLMHFPAECEEPAYSMLELDITTDECGRIGLDPETARRLLRELSGWVAKLDALDAAAPRLN